MGAEAPQKTEDKRITPAFRAQAGKGRPKGVLNKNTAALKDMIMTALSMAGGEQYLADRAKDTPGAFMSLVGKVLPLQVSGDPDGAPINVKNTIDISSAPDEVLRWIASQAVNAPSDNQR